MVRTGWDTGSTASAFGIAAHANVPSSSFVAPFIRPGSGEKYTLSASNRCARNCNEKGFDAAIGLDELMRTDAH